MEFLGQSSSFFSILSITLTVLALLGSTVYTIRNVMRIWKAGKPKPVELDEDETEQKMSKGDSESDSDVVAENNLNEQLSGGGDANNRTALGDIDPYEYCEHIQSEVKKAKQRVTAKHLQSELTPEQIQEEREAQKKQLEEIFKLMQTQGDKFGVNSMGDVQQQMKLYV